MFEDVIKIKVSSETSKEILEEFIEGRSDMEVFSYEDDIDRLSTHVENLRDAMEAFKKSGINWQVFTLYLRGKGIPQRDVDRVLKGVDEFLKDIN